VADKLEARNLPFVFVTGFGDDGILPKHLRSVRRFTKPYEMETILPVLARHVEGGREASEGKGVT
jgi:FixJ family two-component response regulator